MVEELSINDYIRQEKKSELRGNRKYKKLMGDLDIQLIDYQESHDVEKPRHYQILIFGIDKDSNSYCIKVNDYKPYFYIEIPEELTYMEFKSELLELEIKGKYFNSTIRNMIYNKKNKKYMIKKVEYKKFKSYNLKKTRFVKLSFNKYWDYKNIERVLKEQKYKLYESNIPPLLTFFHNQDLKASGWISIKKEKYIELTEFKLSNCQYEIEVRFDNVKPSSKYSIGPIITLSFDIETTTSDGGFPQFKRKGDKIIQIGTTVEMYGNSDWSYRFITTLGDCNKIPNCKVIPCSNEIDLLLEWVKMVNVIDPDIITGYNTLGYDYEYMYERSKLLGIRDEFCSFSRLKNILNGNESEVQKERKLYIQKKLSSNAMGDNTLKSINITGRVNIDLLKYVRDNGDKLTSYKLDNVASHYIGQKKNDMPYHEIFRIYNENGTAEEKTKVAQYCIQDCKLCNKLINKLSVIQNTIGMANTCHVPLSYLFSRGQGIKAHSLLVKYCAQLGYLVPTKEKNVIAGGFKGATVLSAMKGAHFYPVSALDFASLYPSCMISHNICISSKITLEEINRLKMDKSKYRKIEWTEEMTGFDIVKILSMNEEILDEILENYNDFKNLIMNREYLKEVIYKSNPIKEKVRLLGLTKLKNNDEKFFKILCVNIKDLKIFNFKDDNNKIYKGILWEKRHYYVQPLDENNNEIKEKRGVLPIILKKLLDKRNETKKRMKKEKDPFQKSILNGLQLAYKITANSIYGQLGAITGPFSNLGVAASVTTTGRQLLEFAQDIILKNYHNSVAVYGDTDSVFIAYELKRHKEDCPYNQKNIKKRIKKFHKYKDKYEEKMREKNSNFLHTRGGYAMLNLCKFRLHEKCDCELIEDKMSEEALKVSIELAQESDALITSMLPCRKCINDNGEKVGVQQLEYEKTYQPYILFSKKRYVGKLYEFDTNQKTGWYLDYKGIILKRRDNCGILKKFYKGCLDHIMNGEPDKAFSFLQVSLMDLLNNHKTEKYSIDNFTITKTLKPISSYKKDKKTGKVHLAHVMLAERVKVRDPGNAFQSNERVPYCFIEIKEKKGDKILQGNKIETPTYIKENNKKLDYLYYIVKQLEKPITQLFEHIDHERIKNMFKRTINKAKMDKKGIRSITSFLKPVKKPRQKFKKTFEKCAIPDSDEEDLI
jgi:DNA polymerase elongation subunit (family B)